MRGNIHDAATSQSVSNSDKDEGDGGAEISNVTRDDRTNPPALAG